MKRRLKKSTHWYDRAGFEAHFDARASGIVADILRQNGGGWQLGGRIELTIYENGDYEMRFPLRKGRLRWLKVLDIPAGEGEK